MNKRNIGISLIVPVHNSQKYLEECLESIDNNTDIFEEILCIDGGSTDQTPEIIEYFSKRNQRIQYLKDPNTSYGHKINLGIERAKSEYVAILESDDKLYMPGIKTLFEIATRTRADVVDGNYFGFLSYKDKKIVVTMRKYDEQQCEYDNLINIDNAERNDIPNNGIWTALYRKDFLDKYKIRLNESPGASYQDVSFMFLTGLLAETKYHHDGIVYQYRLDNAGSSVKDGAKIFEIIGEIEFLKNELEKRNLLDGNIWRKYEKTREDCFVNNYKKLSGAARIQFMDAIKNKQLEDTILEMQMESSDLAMSTVSLLEKIEHQKVVIFGAGRRGENCWKF